ncbi:MAG: hypothetical protein LBU36_01765 [Clostridiales bacterium]|jgi:hypothetical protein|nr:hypothetical protein [Clostridiales bacterium]
MKNWKKQLIAVICIIFMCSLPLIANYYSLKRNAKLLEANLAKLSETGQTEVTLEELAPFEWDKLYIFGAYFDVSEVYKTVGYNFGLAWKSGVTDEERQFVFMNGRKAVCYEYKAYDGHIVCKVDDSAGYSVIMRSKGLVFRVDRSGGGIKLYPIGK